MQRQQLPVMRQPKRHLNRLIDENNFEWLAARWCANTYRFEHFRLLIDVLCSTRNKQLIILMNIIRIFICSNVYGNCERPATQYASSVFPNWIRFYFHLIECNGNANLQFKRNENKYIAFRSHSRLLFKFQSMKTQWTVQIQMQPKPHHI